MKKIFVIFFMFLFIINCKNQPTKNDNLTDRKELINETKALKMLLDSFNSTGNYNYMKKYVLKTNDLIKKFPDIKGFKQTKKMMLDMYSDSLHLETDTVNKTKIKAK